jgi:hypothetical protein
MASVEERLKRGIIREDGMVFECYNKNSKGGEIWLTPERFQHARNLEKKRVERNREKLRKSCREYKSRNRDAISRYNKKYRKENAEKIKQLSDNWYKNNREYAIKSASQRILKRRKTDNLFKFKDGIRLRILCSIRRMGYTKKSKTQEILGCSWGFFKRYIEQRWIAGMTWENHGMWHFDHVVPISSAKTKNEVMKLNHYTNFRPLWAKDNLLKKDKVDTQLEISL